MPLPPRAVTASAVSSTVPGRLSVVGLSFTLRPVTYTVAPRSPSVSAIPRPAPRLAPVTTATLSFRFDMRSRLRQISPHDVDLQQLSPETIHVDLVLANFVVNDALRAAQQTCGH